MMKTKKIILFIVEGKTDRIVIDSILHSSYFKEKLEDYRPEFLQINGDILADYDSKGKNIISIMANLVVKWRKSGALYSGIRVSDIQEIVHVIDMDGVYIPSDCVHGSLEVNRFTYENDKILAHHKQPVLERNNRKKKVIDKLVCANKIDNVPYSIYYFSCNMDHVIHNKRNNTSKADDAYSFALKCKEDETILKETVFHDEIGTPYYYGDSWEFIKLDCNSLSRQTNFNLFFTKDAKNAK